MILPEFLFFDLDNTILDFKTAERTALRQALCSIGIEPDSKMLDRYSILNDEQWKLLEKGLVSRDVLKVRRFENLFREYDIDIDPKEAASAYEKLLGEGHFFMKDAETVLEKLFCKTTAGCSTGIREAAAEAGSVKKTHRMFIVSNGSASVQHSRIRGAGIEKYFEKIFISEEIGWNKPDRRFFDAVFDAIDGFDRSRAVIIGDSLSSDIKGGINAGIGTIWFDHSGSGSSTGIQPDKVIHSLSELIEGEDVISYCLPGDKAGACVENGRVSIVGAGCGKADLITLRGMERLSHCGAVVYDDLIDTGLLNAAPQEALRIYMGKRLGSHSAQQEEINRKLIELAGKGIKVVRLKGGDPFVFGRGGEEAAALQNAGIDYEIIPGISSCIAIPEEAGIPVTHRGVSRSLHVVTAHIGNDGEGQNYLREEFGRLAGCEGTIVIMMGLKKLSEIADILISGGSSPETPAAVISGGNSANKITVRGSLKDIVQRTAEAGMKPPAVIVIGDTAGMDLRSLCTEPEETEEPAYVDIKKGHTDAGNILSGAVVGLTGTEAIQRKLRDRLTGLGAEVYSAGLSVLDRLRIDDSVFTELCSGEEHWIVFTSANGVRVFFEELKQRHIDIRRLSACSFAVIGEATGKTLSEYNIEADLCPGRYTGQGLAEALLSVYSGMGAGNVQTRNAEDLPPICGGKGYGRKVFLMRSRRGSRALAEELAAAYEVRDIPIYDLHADKKTEETAFAQMPKTDYMTFSSSSGVELYFANGRKLPEGCIGVCIGEVTEKALQKYASDYIRAEEISADGIVKAICAHRTPAADRK